jgi:hypothetical protein
VAERTEGELVEAISVEVVRDGGGESRSVPGGLVSQLGVRGGQIERGG